nr:MAG: hypothetical protein TU35_02665 [Thermoproteus sp. AZ2]
MLKLKNNMTNIIFIINQIAANASRGIGPTWEYGLDKTVMQSMVTPGRIALRQITARRHTAQNIPHIENY